MPSQPLFSVIVPVFNGAAFLDRALESLGRQTLADWEALVVDDASTDASWPLLEAWAAREPRLRLFRHPSHRGASAARNQALIAARGEWIAYLDCDDEFYPDHLARAYSHRSKGDVLLFRYDWIDERPGHPRLGERHTHDPATRFHALATEVIAVPLGVIHRHELLARAGYFNESLRLHEDADLWRRFSNAGARFAAVAAESGLYHIRSDSQSRTPLPAPAALEATEIVDVIRGSEHHALTLPAAESKRVDRIFGRGDYTVPLDRFSRPPVVFDIGGHCGTFALYAPLAIHRDAVVHSFEPDPHHFQLLKQNVAGFAGITAHPFGLGHGDSTTHRNVFTIWDELGADGVDILKIDATDVVAILEQLGERLASVRVVMVDYRTPADRRRVDALLAGHELFGATIRCPGVGILKYLRADLLESST